MELTLHGHNALVTGANGGLGRHFAQTLAAAGARVVIAARRIESLEPVRDAIHATGGHVACITLDVTDAACVSAAFDAAHTALGPITVVVNNAGVAVTKPLV
ncbi:MAG TPA: SDR family NAD(P)-dependent oxidoreductase, partial [Casimicrobiaceae bacterium]|nr:SDR family NAD(P)-dependent oxidoreductase [Casimicrobiaceae bacterium]